MKEKIKENKKRKMEKEQKQITKNMSFAEIIRKEPKAAEILIEKGMHCIGCPMAMQESLEQGALTHGLDPDEITEEINKKIAKSKKK